MKETKEVSTKKEDIIRKAFAVFVNNGYYETSIADLAKVCEMPKALFYYYFTNKEDLMVEVLKFTQQYSLQRFKKLSEDDTLNAKEKLAALSVFFEKYYSTYEGGCIMGNTLGTAFPEDRFIPIMKDFFEAWIEALTKIYMACYQEEKARELAEATIQDIQGGLLLMKLYKDKKYLRNALKRSEKLLD